MTELTEQATRLGLLNALAESQANDLFAMKLLAESQAREKVLRDALENHQNQTRPIQKTIEALAQKVDLAGLAREAVLREKLAFAIELIDDYYAHEKSEFLAVLAQPSDDSALNKLLAEGQSREKALRDALEYALKGFQRFDYVGDEWKGRSPIIDALAQSTDDTPLRDALAAERERCAKLCDERAWGVDGPAKNCANAIRALGDE